MLGCELFMRSETRFAYVDQINASDAMFHTSCAFGSESRDWIDQAWSHQNHSGLSI